MVDLTPVTVPEAEAALRAHAFTKHDHDANDEPIPGSAGSFARGAETLGVSPGSSRAVALGFRASEGTRAEYALLTDAWRQALVEEA